MYIIGTDNMHDYGDNRTFSISPVTKKEVRSKCFVELLTEYSYFKPAAGVPAEKSNHIPFLDYGRNKKHTSITVIAVIVVISIQSSYFFVFFS